MSSKRRRTLAALQITMQLTVQGGLLHQPRCLDARPATFEGREVQFVPVANSEDWVCQMASGKGRCKRPLARCKVMAELRRKVMEHVSMDSAIGDPMCDMTFADSARVTLRLLEQVSAYKNKQMRRDTASSEAAVVPVLMKACPGASADAERTRVLILMHGHKMFMEVNALPWLLNYLLDEFDSAGAEPVLGSPKKDDAVIWWDLHHDCWAGRFKTPDGKNVRKTASVRWRMGDGGDLGDMSFEDAESVVHQEFLLLHCDSDKQGAPAVVEVRS